jgi:hypothetical protein
MTANGITGICRMDGVRLDADLRNEAHRREQRMSRCLA